MSDEPLRDPVSIPLNHRKRALIDAEDLPRLAPFRWYAMPQNGRWFAVRGTRTDPHSPGRQATVWMHRVILDAPHDRLVAHRNGDTLDNRRANLILVGRTELAAMRGLNRNNTSGYRGVWRDRKSGRWRAELALAGRKLSLGRYATPEEAARAYDAKAREVFGALAYQNFPEQTEE